MICGRIQSLVIQLKIMSHVLQHNLSCFSCDIKSGFIPINITWSEKVIFTQCVFISLWYTSDHFHARYPINLFGFNSSTQSLRTLGNVSSEHTHAQVKVFGKQKARAAPSPVLAIAFTRIHQCWQKSITTNCWMSIGLRSDMATKATSREYARVTAESRVACQAIS